MAGKLSSQPVHLKVSPNDPNTAPADQSSQLAFLSLSLPKKALYVGEVLVGELRLYVRIGARDLSNVEIPSISGDGFNVGKYVQGAHVERNVGGTAFTVIPLQFSLSPVKAGKLTLNPLTGSAVVYLPSNRGRDVIDFFNPRGQPHQVRLSAPGETIVVSPLPATNVPPGFNGAVGSYSLSLNAGPTNVGVGDPITVKVQITGHGSLDSLTWPQQDAWHDFKLYPPTAKPLDTSDPLALQGTKTFEQIIVPQSADVKEIPPVSFSFFDPERKAYRTLSDPAIGLTVHPAASAAEPTILSNARPGQDAPPSQDIVPIKQHLGTLAQIGPVLLREPWFLALQGVPLVAWLSTVIWRRRQESLANNPRLRRQRQVAVVIRDGLGELQRLAAENKSDEFFATVFRLLQEQLGERLDLPATAITESVIEERLLPRGASESVVAGLQDLFQMCNLARYAPIKSSQELAAVIPRVQTVLGELQALKA